MPNVSTELFPLGRAYVGSIKEQGKIHGPVNPDRKLAPIAVSDIGEAAAIVLRNPAEHTGKTYTLTTTPYSTKELAEAFSEALGKPVEYVQVPFEAAKQAMLGLGLPEWQADGIVELLQKQDKGDKAIVTKTEDFKTIVGREPLTIQQWTAAVKGGFQ